MKRLEGEKMGFFKACRKDVDDSEWRCVGGSFQVGGAVKEQDLWSKNQQTMGSKFAQIIDVRHTLNAGPQQQRPELPTITPPSMR